MEGLKAELMLYENTSVASLGWDKVRFKAPIFPGDMLQVRVRFTGKRESRSRPHGIIVEDIAMTNQHGVVAIEAEHAAMVLRRRETAA
jgi:acyl dehydratase